MRERRWLFISIKKSAVPRICFWGQTVLSPPLMIQDVNKSTSYLQKQHCNLHKSETYSQSQFRTTIVVVIMMSINPMQYANKTSPILLLRQAGVQDYIARKILASIQRGPQKANYFFTHTPAYGSYKTHHKESCKKSEYELVKLPLQCTSFGRNIHRIHHHLQCIPNVRKTVYTNKHRC